MNKVALQVKNPQRVAAAKKAWATRRRHAKLNMQLQLKLGTPSIPKPPEADTAKPFITKFFPNQSMSQMYRSGLEFAFVSADGEQCHAFAYCKDFLTDAVWAHLNKTTAAIYSFSYGPKSPPIDVDYTRVALRNKQSSDFVTKCQNTLRFLNLLEPDFGMQPTRLLDGGDFGGPVFVFVGDKQWMYAPPLISLYTLLLRVGQNYQDGPWRDRLKATSGMRSSDVTYLQTSRPAILKLAGQQFDKIFAKTWKGNYPSECSVDDMHESAGICALAGDSVSTRVKKNWAKKKF